MDIVTFITEERKVELEEILKKEILLLQEQTISREEFIKIIRQKTSSIGDLYYLVNKYIGKIIILEENSIIDRLKEALSLCDSDYFDTEATSNIIYNSKQKQKLPNIKHLKKIKKYEKYK